MKENVSPLISQLSHQPRRSNLVSSCGLNLYVHTARELLLQDSGSQDKGAVHKQVCVTLNVKLPGGGGGHVVMLLNYIYWYHMFVGAELLNLFVGKARCYSHDCSWDLPG